MGMSPRLKTDTGRKPMATARILDQEASIGQRPQRPDVLPPGAPDSAVHPDVPDTTVEKDALKESVMERNQQSGGKQRGADAHDSSTKRTRVQENRGNAGSRNGDRETSRSPAPGHTRGEERDSGRR